MNKENKRVKNTYKTTIITLFFEILSYGFFFPYEYFSLFLSLYYCFYIV